MSKQDVLDYLEKRSEYFYDLSDRIWDCAEVRFEEKDSSETLADVFDKEGFTVTKDLGGLDTSFKAVWGSGSPVIGFCGEYDALPGLSQKAGIAAKETDPKTVNGHGCGHNLLGVGAAMGAIGLKHYLETDGKDGTVVFFGCPAEEGGSGKTFMARDGCFKGLDCALSWHPAPVNMVISGTLLANCTVRYSFIGRAAHAAGCPELGRSALDALELMNIGIQFLREHIPSSARIHYAITDTGGISPNIVQPSASGIYQLRAPYTPMLNDIYARVSDIARGAALMTGTEVKIEYLKGTSNFAVNHTLGEVIYENMCRINNPIAEAEDFAFAEKIIRTQFDQDRLPENVIDPHISPYSKQETVLPGSSDTGDVSWNCPMSQFGVTTWPAGTAAHSWQAVACGKSDFAHRGMLFAGQILAASAVDICEDPQILKDAWDEFRNRTGGKDYKCPIPDEITPEYLKKALK